MSTDNRFVKAVAKLNELTQEKHLKWVRDTDTNTITYGTEDFVEVAYYTDYGSKRLRLYELRYKDYPDASWDTMVVLEVVDKDGRTEWRFPQTPAARHLWESVRYNTSGVDDLIKELLDEAPF